MVVVVDFKDCCLDQQQRGRSKAVIRGERFDGGYDDLKPNRLKLDLNSETFWTELWVRSEL